jgi:hypothetical protein
LTRTSLYCLGCGIVLGHVSNIVTDEEVANIRQKHSGKCPNCGRELESRARQATREEATVMTAEYGRRILKKW